MNRSSDQEKYPDQNFLDSLFESSKHLKPQRIIDPIKYQAQMAVRKGIDQKRIKVPNLCKLCNQPEKVYGRALSAHHYLGYEQEHWFDIVFLCNLCHNMVHKDPTLLDLD
jgi:hypothetical protein